MTEQNTQQTPAVPGGWFNTSCGNVFRKAFRLCSTSINAAITLSVRTHKKRWARVAQDPNPHWDWRNEIISKIIPSGASVLDLGCGAQTLRRHLSPDCKYQPCDLIKSSPDVILCDFNEGIYPAVTKRFDYVICSGVLEYIRKPHEFLKRCSAFGETMILSYCPLVAGQGKLQRLAVNWVNHFTISELEALFAAGGLSWNVINKQDHGETIYSLSIQSTARCVPTIAVEAPASIGGTSDE